MSNDLHGRMMNIQASTPDRFMVGTDEYMAYKLGHRDARHAAAELAIEYEAATARLLEVAQRLADALSQARRALVEISDCYIGDDDEAGECASCHERSYKPHAPHCAKQLAVEASDAALAEWKEAQS